MIFCPMCLADRPDVLPPHFDTEAAFLEHLRGVHRVRPVMRTDDGFMIERIPDGDETVQ